VVLAEVDVPCTSSPPPSPVLAVLSATCTSLSVVEVASMAAMPPPAAAWPPPTTDSVMVNVPWLRMSPPDPVVEPPSSVMLVRVSEPPGSTSMSRSSPPALIVTSSASPGS
jgi:hypothetical protein